MNRTQKVCGLLFLAMAWVLGGWAQRTDGVGSAAFLRRGVDARAMGMGGAYVAVAEGYSAMYWNPAGLARALAPEVGGMTANICGVDIFFNFLAARLAWDFSPQTPSVGSSEPEEVGGEEPNLAGAEPGLVGGVVPRGTTFRLAVGLSWTEMSTEVFAFDEYGSPLGLIRYTEALYGLGVAGWVPRLGYLGGVAKAYSYRAPKAGVGGADATAFGIGFDLGLTAPVWEEKLWLGLAAADAGDTRVKWKNTPTEPTDKVAGRYTAGLALFAPNLVLEGDRLVLAVDGVWEPLVAGRSVRGGVEYTLLFLSLRAGAVWRENVGFSLTAGAGIRALGLVIDGAWVQNRELAVEGAGHTLVISAFFRF